MTDHWHGAADQVARQLAEARETVERLRTENADLRRWFAETTDDRDALAAQVAELHEQLDEARTAVRELGQRRGRCGHRLDPIVAGGTPVFCALPYGHEGWHRDGSTEWGPNEGSDRPGPTLPPPTGEVS